MKSTPIDSKGIGRRNEKVLLTLIRKHGPLSQAQLCKLAGLGSSTTSYIIGRLREKELIEEQLGQSSRPGAKPTLVSVNSRGRYLVGTEINPSYLLMGLFDFDGQKVESVKIALNGDHSVENVILILEINLLGLISKHNVDQTKLIGIGVTLSGSVSLDGVVELSSPLGWKLVPLKEKLSQLFDSSIDIYSTRVRLLAEIGIEPQLSSKNVLYLNIGNGVGGTIFEDGKLLHGATGRFGELGHMIVNPEGPRCGCGHRGCLEALISGPALAAKMKQDIAAGRETALSTCITDEVIPEVVIEHWSRAVEQGDRYAVEVKDYLTDEVARAVSAAINYYDPDVVMLAGYVSWACLPYLIDAVKSQFASDVYDHTSRHIEVLGARAGEETLIRGAAIALLHNYLAVT
ncbi:MAG: ROK family protein [Planctomycetes bacterium]|nr:ROK family protein [Planctomycetota bacterium]